MDKYGIIGQRFYRFGPWHILNLRECVTDHKLDGRSTAVGEIKVGTFDAVNCEVKTNDRRFHKKSHIVANMERVMRVECKRYRLARSVMYQSLHLRIRNT